MHEWGQTQWYGFLLAFHSALVVCTKADKLSHSNSLVQLNIPVRLLNSNLSAQVSLSTSYPPSIQACIGTLNTETRWTLLVLNCNSNYLHSVVSHSSCTGECVQNSFSSLQLIHCGDNECVSFQQTKSITWTSGQFYRPTTNAVLIVWRTNFIDWRRGDYYGDIRSDIATVTWVYLFCQWQIDFSPSKR